MPLVWVLKGKLKSILHFPFYLIAQSKLLCTLQEKNAYSFEKKILNFLTIPEIFQNQILLHQFCFVSSISVSDKLNSEYFKIMQRHLVLRYKSKLWNLYNYFLLISRKWLTKFL